MQVELANQTCLPLITGAFSCIYSTFVVITLVDAAPLFGAIYILKKTKKTMCGVIISELRPKSCIAVFDCEFDSRFPSPTYPRFSDLCWSTSHEFMFQELPLQLAHCDFVCLFVWFFFF